MLRPMPMPSALVLKNGENSCPATSGGIPTPLSATSTTASVSVSFAVRNTAIRCSGGKCCMASRAFRKKLTSTCSIMIRSANTMGRSSASCSSHRNARSSSSLSTSFTTSEANKLMSSACRCGSRVRTNSRTRPMIAPARATCASAFSIAPITAISASPLVLRRLMQPFT